MLIVVIHKMIKKKNLKKSMFITSKSSQRTCRKNPVCFDISHE